MVAMLMNRREQEDNADNADDKNYAREDKVQLIMMTNIMIMMMVATSPPAPPSVLCCVIAFIPGPHQPASTRHHCWISSNVSGGPWFPSMTPMRL